MGFFQLISSMDCKNDPFPKSMSVMESEVPFDPVCFCD